MNVEQIKQELGTKEMPDNLVYLIEAVKNIFAAANASYSDGLNVMIALIAEIADGFDDASTRDTFKNLIIAAYEKQLDHLAAQHKPTIN